MGVPGELALYRICSIYPHFYAVTSYDSIESPAASLNRDMHIFAYVHGSGTPAMSLNVTCRHVEMLVIPLTPGTLGRSLCSCVDIW